MSIDFGSGYGAGDLPITIDEAGNVRIKQEIPYSLPESTPDKASIGIPTPTPEAESVPDYEPPVPTVAPPTAKFAFVEFALFRIKFVNESLGEVDSLLWDFGDGNSSTEEHPEHRYTAGGTYDVTLTINNAGGSDIFKLSVIVADPPAFVDFNWAAGGFTVYFTNISNTGSWQWDFGDGSSSTEENPAHTYIANGLFTVVLRSEGQVVTKTIKIDVDILLSWTDNSDDEDGFRIEHSLTGEEGSWSEVNTVGADITSYGVSFVEDGIDSGVSNYFRVFAFNAAGDSENPTNELLTLCGGS